MNLERMFHLSDRMTLLHTCMLYSALYMNTFKIVCIMETHYCQFTAWAELSTSRELQSRSNFHSLKSSGVIPFQTGSM